VRCGHLRSRCWCGWCGVGVGGEVEAPAASHSRRLLMGICCTTTRLRRTSVCLLRGLVRIVINAGGGGLKTRCWGC
jgi:hypothetical protein